MSGRHAPAVSALNDHALSTVGVLDALGIQTRTHANTCGVRRCRGEARTLCHDCRLRLCKRHAHAWSESKDSSHFYCPAHVPPLLCCVVQ
jgi:hypothetical protein